jgi:hypothetical protein
MAGRQARASIDAAPKSASWSCCQLVVLGGGVPKEWISCSCGVRLLVLGDPLVVDRAVVVEGGVPPGVVVERDPGEDRQPYLFDAVPAGAELAFEGGEEALGDRVVQRVADAAHRLDHAMVVARTWRLRWTYTHGGWSAGHRPSTPAPELAGDALDAAATPRGGNIAGIVFHTDHGAQPRFKGSSQHRLGERSIGVG